MTELQKKQNELNDILVKMAAVCKEIAQLEGHDGYEEIKAHYENMLDLQKQTVAEMRKATIQEVLSDDTETNQSPDTDL
jgi:phage-related minor tail protein